MAVRSGGEGVVLGVEIPGVNGIGVWATDQLDFHNVVGGDHAGVTGMKLVSQPLLIQPFLEAIDAVCPD